MLLRAVLIALLVGALAVLVAAPAQAAGFRPCAKIPIGFTSAKISAQGMTCAAARDLFQAWRQAARKAAPKNGPAPARITVGLFSCHLGGNDLTVKLDCAGADGKQKMRGRWGG